MPGKKFDASKPRADLLVNGMPRALLAVSDVLTYGARKYAAHNWLELQNADERYKAALMRHLLAESCGELVDAESGKLHVAHEACNALFRLELALRAMENERKSR